MCIIVAKKKGINIPNEETLRECFNRNSDGAGLMYVKDGKIHIEKGYMTFAAFIERLNNLNKELNFKEKSLVMHFRITTSGGTKPENCHPFPISDKVEDLKATSIITEDVAMAHNGIINTYSGVLENDKLSDTQLFVQRAVYPIYQLDHEFYKNEAIMNLFEDDLINQVLYNLINNAINYTGEDLRVKINIIENKNNYLVEVIDTGKGIDKKDIEQIWTKYYKNEKNHKRNVVGTGLGLSIVQNILVKHNFKYGVESVKNKGTKFYFYILKANEFKK